MTTRSTPQQLILDKHIKKPSHKYFFIVACAEINDQHGFNNQLRNLMISLEYNVSSENYKVCNVTKDDFPNNMS